MMARNAATQARGDDEDMGNEDLDAEGQGNEGDRGTQRREASEGAAEHDQQEGDGADEERLDPERLPEDEQDEPPARSGGRADRRIEALLARQRELEDEVRSFRTRDTMPAPAAQPQFETDAQFNARIANLPPDERIEARYVRSEQINNARQSQFQTNMLLQADKASYDAKAASNKIYKKYQAEVENELAKALRGERVSWSAAPDAGSIREQILDILIGRKVRQANSGASQEVERQRNQGQRNIRRQTTQPNNPRGDTQGERSRSGGNEREARRRRLENATF
jgi:hypothetical protein